MSAIPQNFLTGQKTVLDNLLAVQTSFFGGFEKLVDLNLAVIKTTLEEASQKSQEIADIKDAQEALAFTNALAQPNAEKALSYSKHVYDIVSGVQADLSRLSEEQVLQSQQQLNDAIDHLAKNAPVGSEGAVALLKSSVVTAAGAYDSVAKAARNAADAAESNIAAATSATMKATSDAAQAAKPSAGARRATA